MTKRNFIAICIGMGIAYFVYDTNLTVPPPPAFPELTGPIESTVIPSNIPPRTVPETYFDESTSGIAVLLQDSNASWLGIAHGLKSIGVPFRVVQSIDEALQHEVILVYPSITGSNTEPETLSALANHVRDGHTLIAFSVIGGGLPSVFGFETTEERNDLVEVNFDPAYFDPDSILEIDESRIRLASLVDPTPFPGVSYHELKHPAIATYDDGSAAITHNFFTANGRVGHAYAVGFDFGHFILRAQNNRFSGLADTYVNNYQPMLDTLLEFMAAVYKEGSQDAVQILPTPFNREFTALITHDIDYTRSLQNTLAYAEFEFSQNIPATYFIQTKYVTDFSDEAFFNLENQAILTKLRDQGMEIGSHSVAHSNEFKGMPIGSGTEQYPSYRPFVSAFDAVRDGSISGELRISKYLLDTLVEQDTVSFRPGHLSMPISLPEMLQATGYQYSSSMTANSAFTHLPFRSNYSRSYDTELDIIEIPITIEDESGRLGDRLPEAIALANKIARIGGVVNVLIHTDVLDHKLEFEKGFVAEFKERAWFGTIAQFGQWWATRDSAVIQTDTPAAYQKRLQISIEGRIAGLSIKLPNNWRYTGGLEGTVQHGNVVVLGEFANQAQLLFSASSSN